MNTAHAIVCKPATAYRTDHYGITHESVWVYVNPSSGGYPTRVVVWSNEGRPNPRNGEPVRFGDYGPRDGGNGRYLDPNNRATDDAVSILLSPESVSIDAYGTGTGTAASGQVWAPEREALRDGDTVTLVYFDGETAEPAGEFRVDIPRHSNGHGRLVPITGE